MRFSGNMQGHFNRFMDITFTLSCQVNLLEMISFVLDTTITSPWNHFNAWIFHFEGEEGYLSCDMSINSSDQNSWLWKLDPTCYVCKVTSLDMKLSYTEVTCYVATILYINFRTDMCHTLWLICGMDEVQLVLIKGK